MHFDLVDAVLEQSESRIVTVKNVSAAEEYLQDHFPTFPVLPGVLMVESLVQAARRLLAHRCGDDRLVLGAVRALKYGSFVRPGESLRVEVVLHKANPDGSFDLKGEGVVVRSSAAAPSGAAEPARTAVSGRFAMRPIAVCPQPAASGLGGPVAECRTTPVAPVR